MSLECTKEILKDRKEFDSYKNFEKLFILLPLEHSEKIENGARMIEEAKIMIENAPNEEIKKCNGQILDFAKDHHGVLEKFGRYPSRN